MIRHFRCKETERLFHRRFSRSLPTDVQRSAQRKLEILNAATSLQDLWRLPGNRLEKLRGARKGQYSLRINQQWRICFTWIDKEARNVEVVDYH